MSYTPTEWKAGDVVTSEKLNNIENGIEDAGTFFVTFSRKEGSSDESPEIECDKTSNEIWDAFSSGKQVVGLFGGNIDGADTYMFIPITSVMKFSNFIHFGFEMMSIGGGNTILTKTTIDINGNGTTDVITFSTASFQLTPAFQLTPDQK